LLLHSIFVGDNDLVLFVLKVVVFAGKFVDLIFKIKAVGLVQQRVVVLVKIADYLLLLGEVLLGIWII
jgi:hypothetical protein